jgi:hypothetical protein
MMQRQQTVTKIVLVACVLHHLLDERNPDSREGGSSDLHRR